MYCKASLPQEGVRSQPFHLEPFQGLEFNMSRRKVNSFVRWVGVFVLACGLFMFDVPQANAMKAYEPMSDAILLALRKAVREGVQPPRPVFDSTRHKIHWLTEMSKRLKKWVPSTEKRHKLIRLIRYEAQRAGLDPQLIFALIEVESSFRADAVSHVGARGLMQIMPFWTEVLSKGDADKLFIPEINVRYGCLILSHYVDIEKGNVARALARYNGSLGRTIYSDKVLGRLRQNWDYSW